MYDEQLEDDLKLVMRDTRNTLDRMIKDAPEELRKSEVSINFVIEAIKTVVDRYQKSFNNIAEKMSGSYKDPETLELASEIKKQINELEEMYGIEIDTQKLDELVKPVDFIVDDVGITNERTETKGEDELIAFMTESIATFDALLEIDIIDSDEREIYKKTIEDSIGIYKNSLVFTQIRMFY